jgi:hypothetical protein
MAAHLRSSGREKSAQAQDDRAPSQRNNRHDYRFLVE